MTDRTELLILKAMAFFFFFFFLGWKGRAFLVILGFFEFFLKK